MKYLVFLYLFFGIYIVNAQTFTLADSTFTVGDSLVKKIYFNYDKADIRPESKPFLDSLAQLLVRFPQIQLEVACHTDYRGKDVYNHKLSQRRAQCIADYLIWKGVEKKNLIPIGFGEIKPVIRKSIIDKMKALEEKEAAHSTNRRTTFIIRKIN